MRAVVGEMPGDPGEQVLVGFARHQVAVFQRFPAEFRQQIVAAAVKRDTDSALVLIDLMGGEAAQQRRRVIRRAVPELQCACAVHASPPHTTRAQFFAITHNIL